MDEIETLRLVERLTNQTLSAYIPAAVRRDLELAASTLTAQSAEIARLNEAIQYEQHRAGRIGTHGPGCHAWGPQHYECAVARIKELEAGRVAQTGAYPPRIDLALGACQVAAKTDQLDVAQAFAQTAIDFITGDYEPLDDDADRSLVPDGEAQ